MYEAQDKPGIGIDCGSIVYGMFRTTGGTGRYDFYGWTDAGYGPKDFFIYAMSGTEDFAYGAFTNQIQAMLDAPGGIFIDAVSENDGNLAYRVQEGNAHDGDAALQYIYNGLIWLWAE